MCKGTAVESCRVFCKECFSKVCFAGLGYLHYGEHRCRRHHNIRDNKNATPVGEKFKYVLLLCVYSDSIFIIEASR